MNRSYIILFVIRNSQLHIPRQFAKRHENFFQIIGRRNLIFPSYSPIWDFGRGGRFDLRPLKKDEE